MRSERSSSTASRPHSAPGGPLVPRFDPTEYVRQKRDREAAAANRTRTTFSPASSRPPSPSASRPSSAVLRGSQQAPRRRSVSADRAPPTRSRSAGRAEPHTTEAHHDSPSSSSAVTGPPAGHRRRSTSKNDIDRDMSPGRALQQVCSRFRGQKQRVDGLDLDCSTLSKFPLSTTRFSIVRSHRRPRCKKENPFDFHTHQVPLRCFDESDRLVDRKSPCCRESRD